VSADEVNPWAFERVVEARRQIEIGQRWAETG